MVRQHVTRRRAIIVDMHGQHDHVAAILDAWRAEDPGLDVSPVAIFGRVTQIDRFLDRKSTRLNSSHGSISYAVFCLKKKKKKKKYTTHINKIKNNLL